MATIGGISSILLALAGAGVIFTGQGANNPTRLFVGLLLVVTGGALGLGTFLGQLISIFCFRCPCGKSFSAVPRPAGARVWVVKCPRCAALLDASPKRRKS